LGTHSTIFKPSIYVVVWKP